MNYPVDKIHFIVYNIIEKCGTTSQSEERKVKPMSSNEISKTLKDLYELRAMRTELDDEITALEDQVKAEMAERGVDELEGAGHTAKYAEYTSMRFDASAFKKAQPELAAEYTKATTARRFTLN